MTADIQRYLLTKAKQECYERMDREPRNISSGLWCNRTWDDIMCWNDASADTKVAQTCPEYIHGFKQSNFAFKTCTKAGAWYRKPDTNTPWTDYSSCLDQLSQSMTEHMNRIFSIMNFGYGVSFISLSAAIIIMVSCRRLSYKSNILHINLFLAFCVRSIFALLRHYLFTYGYAMSIDMEEKDGKFIFKQGSHWECRLLFTLFLYGISVSQCWIFVEGLYLQMLFYRTLSTQQGGIKLYIIFGWCFPLTFLIPWVIARLKYDNVLCWSINQRIELLWIIRAPLVLTIVISFIFFIDNIRILFKRTQARMRNTSRKLAKFTVMLVPLFGVPNILFILIPPKLNTMVDLPYMYISMPYSSLQGLILSFLYCFLHVEVHSAIRKTCNRFIQRRRVNLSLQNRSGHAFVSRRKQSFASTNQSQLFETEMATPLQENDLSTMATAATATTVSPSSVNVATATVTVAESRRGQKYKGPYRKFNSRKLSAIDDDEQSVDQKTVSSSDGVVRDQVPDKDNSGEV